MAKDFDTVTSIEQEELQGISRSVVEIEWLLLILVLLYYVLGGIENANKPPLSLSMVIYAFFVMGWRYTGVFKQESRWKIAVETWVMTGFITSALWYTGRLQSPLLNAYLLVIVTSALATGKLATLLEMFLIAICFVFLGSHSEMYEILSQKYASGMFAQFVPFVVVAYITSTFASDIRYGLNKAKVLSETDELTGALNRRGFSIIADRIFGTAIRYNRPLSLLLLDSDNLKLVNDNHGHQAGDQLLITLVKIIQTELRQSDVLSRQGGDEFAVLLPETPASGALDVAERIRIAIEHSPLVLDGKTIHITVSIGVTSYPSEGHSLDVLLAQADQKMYKAKHGGRNRVVMDISV
jgi:diguanylate cyclase (GGDEF)-like protein